MQLRTHFSILTHSLPVCRLVLNKFNFESNFSQFTCMERTVCILHCKYVHFSQNVLIQGYRQTCKFKYENDTDILVQVNIVRMDLWIQHFRKTNFRCHINSLRIFNTCRDREKKKSCGMGITETPNPTFYSKLSKWKIHSIISTTELPARDDEFNESTQHFCQKKK